MSELVTFSRFSHFLSEFNDHAMNRICDVWTRKRRHVSECLVSYIHRCMSSNSRRAETRMTRSHGSYVIMKRQNSIVYTLMATVDTCFTDAVLRLVAEFVSECEKRLKATCSDLVDRFSFKTKSTSFRYPEAPDSWPLRPALTIHRHSSVSSRVVSKVVSENIIINQTNNQNTPFN